MEIKVKAVDGNTQKSQAEIEEKLLSQHETEQQEEAKPEVVEAKTTEKPVAEKEQVQVEEPEEKTPSSELNDENVLSYIKDRYGKEIGSVDELFETKESNPDLPEDVKLYFDYKKETGRSIEDFVKLQKDYTAMDDDSVLADYYGIQEEGLDAIDIQDIMEDKFGVDEDVDEPKDVKKKKLAKKRELAKARKFFTEQKDKYKIPLESSGGGLSEDQEKDLNAYKSYIEESKTAEELRQKRHDYFSLKSKEVFNNDFKGFDFSV